MKVLQVVVIAVLILGAMDLIVATESDPTDYILIAYELTAEQENTFNATDKKLSPFWKLWESNAALDYVHEIPLTHGSKTGSPMTGACGTEQGFEDGPDDAQLIARAAWGSKGLYIYVEVLDDQFVGIVGRTDVPDPILEYDYGQAGSEYWMNDCVDMAFDIWNSEEQKKYYLPRYDQTTATFWQYMLRFGANNVMVNYPHPNPTKYKDESGAFETSLGWPLLQDLVSFSECKTKYGIEVEKFGIGENRMGQEWFFPWSKIASGMNKPSRGTRIAMTMGYLDMDGSENKYPDVLLLKDHGNQFTTRPIINGVKFNNCGNSGENWGDLEFGGLLKTTNTLRPLMAAQNSAAVCRDIRYFSVNGRTVTNGVVDRASTLASVRSVILRKQGPMIQMTLGY